MILRRNALWMGVAGLLLLSGGGLVANAKSVSQLQQQELADKALLQKDLSNYQQTKSSVSQAMQRLGQLSGKLTQAKNAAGAAGTKVVETKAQLARTEALLSSTSHQVHVATAHLLATKALYRASVKKFQMTEAKLATERLLFSGQLRLVEEHGSVGYLSVIVGAHSFADFISRVDMLGQIAAGAAHEVQAIRSEAAVARQEESNLAKQKVALAEVQATLVARQNLLNQTQAVVQQQVQAAVPGSNCINPIAPVTLTAL